MTGDNRRVPLCVDLDGTLLLTDSLWESVLQLIRQSPWFLFWLPIWLTSGRAGFKRRVADRLRFHPATLPFNSELLEYLTLERRSGRRLVLVTGADRRIAEALAGQAGVFDEILGTTRGVNLCGSAKARLLTERFGKGGYDYAGNAKADLPVWAFARSALVVSARQSLVNRAGAVSKLAAVFKLGRGGFRAWCVGLRVHQWPKNLLVFVPLLTSFRLTDPAAVFQELCALLSFCLCASAMYVLNDLLDLESDRTHPTKCHRPFASGILPISRGLPLPPLALGLGFAVASLASIKLLLVLAIYVMCVIAYCLYLKTRVLMDVILLSTLYALRVLAGCVAINVRPTVWLLAFSLFLFLSLALVKRCSELVALKAAGRIETPGRNYCIHDLSVLWPLGVSSAVSSLVVFALYVSAGDMPTHYRTPSCLWLVAVGLFYWLGRMWIKTSRGEMTEDPLVFTYKDFGTRMVILCMIVATLAGFFLKL